MTNSYDTPSSEDEIRVRISKGDGRSRPRAGVGRRVLINGMRVDAATAKQFKTWLKEMRKIDPRWNAGKLMDNLMELVKLRGLEIGRGAGRRAKR